MFSKIKSIWVNLKMENWIRQLQSNPFWQSIAEVILTIFFTFIPFVLLSIPFSDGAGELTQASIISKFWSYWNSGELVLPILGLSGAIATLFVLNSRAFNGFNTFLAFLFSVGCALAGGFALAASNGFSQKLYPEVIISGFLMYGLMLLVWLFLSFTVRSDNDRGDPEERADKLLARKKAATGGGNGK